MGGSPTQPVTETFNNANRSEIEQLLDRINDDELGSPVNTTEEFNASALKKLGVDERNLDTVISDGRVTQSELVRLMAEIGIAQPDVQATKHAQEIAERIAVAYGIDDSKAIEGLAKFEALLESEDPRAREIKKAVEGITSTEELFSAIRDTQRTAENAVETAGAINVPSAPDNIVRPPVYKPVV